MRNLYILLIYCLSILPGYAQSVWTGYQNSNWDNPANWSPAPPLSGGTAIIPKDIAGSHTPVISTTVTINYTVQNSNLITIAYYGRVFNNAYFLNNYDGKIINNGKFINRKYFNFHNKGTFENNKIFRNKGSLENGPSGVFNNNHNGYFKNTNSINNFGIVNNFGTFENCSYFFNYSITNNEGIFNNTIDGTFENLSCAEYYQNSDYNTTGDFWNFGIIYQIKGATNATNQGGIVLFDRNSSPQPIARCNNISIQLDSDGTVTLDAEYINNGSSASYCFIQNIEVFPNTFDCSNIGHNIVKLVVTDILGNSNTCEATVNVLESQACQPEINCPPVAENLTICVSSGQSVSGHLEANDPDGHSLRFTTYPLYGPFKGNVYIRDDGKFDYYPNYNFGNDDSDSFFYEVCDGNGDNCSDGCTRGVVYIKGKDICDDGGHDDDDDGGHDDDDDGGHDDDDDGGHDDDDDGGHDDDDDGGHDDDDDGGHDDDDDGGHDDDDDGGHDDDDDGGHDDDDDGGHDDDDDGGHDDDDDGGHDDDDDCCDEGDKPNSISLRYTGESCSATSSGQSNSKVSCDGNPNNAGVVFIIANDKDESDEGNIWFSGQVSLGDVFTIHSQNAGRDDFKSVTWIHIYDAGGNTLLQRIEFHTSCSQPLGVGDQFGSLLIEGISFKDGTVCGESSSTNVGTPSSDCCDEGDKPNSISLLYTGESCSATSSGQSNSKVSCDGNPNNAGVVFIIANDKDESDEGNIWFSGQVNLGDVFTIHSQNAGRDDFKSVTWVHIYDAGGNTLLQRIEFHTSCSQPLGVGDQFGSLLIEGISFKDGTVCGESSSTNVGTPSSDCCDEGDKPNSISLLYTGESCSATSSGQSNSKVSCDGNPNNAGVVFIIANDKDESDEGNIWFSGQVSLGDVFTIHSQNAGRDDFKSVTWVHIYDAGGNTLLQRIEFHTSCSQPLGVGDQFGSLLIEGISFKDGTVCGEASTPTSVNCKCKGGVAALGFRYDGRAATRIKAFAKSNKFLGEYEYVQPGELVYFSASSIHRDKFGKFYLIVNGYPKIELHVSCSQDLIGQSFGPITIVYQADKKGNICSVPGLDCEEIIESCVDDSHSRKAREMLTLDVVRKGLHSELNWVSNTSYKNDYFVIERSMDGHEFVAIAEIPNEHLGDAPHLSFSVDERPLKGINYYRIKEVHLDGSYRYSDIGQLNFQVMLEEVYLFPNPAQKHISVNLRTYAGKDVQLQIFDGKGIIHHTETIAAIQEDQIRVNLSNYTNGMYYMLISVEGYRPIGRRFTIQDLY